MSGAAGGRATPPSPRSSTPGAAGQVGGLRGECPVSSPDRGREQGAARGRPTPTTCPRLPETGTCENVPGVPGKVKGRWTGGRGVGARGVPEESNTETKPANEERSGGHGGAGRSREGAGPGRPIGGGGGGARGAGSGPARAATSTAGTRRISIPRLLATEDSGGRAALGGAGRTPGRAPGFCTAPHPERSVRALPGPHPERSSAPCTHPSWGAPPRSPKPPGGPRAPAAAVRPESRAPPGPHTLNVTQRFPALPPPPAGSAEQGRGLPLLGAGARKYPQTCPPSKRRGTFWAEGWFSHLRINSRALTQSLVSQGARQPAQGAAHPRCWLSS